MGIAISTKTKPLSALLSQGGVLPPMGGSPTIANTHIGGYRSVAKIPSPRIFLIEVGGFDIQGGLFVRRLVGNCGDSGHRGEEMEPTATVTRNSSSVSGWMGRRLAHWRASNRRAWANTCLAGTPFTLPPSSSSRRRFTVPDQAASTSAENPLGHSRALSRSTTCNCALRGRRSIVASICSKVLVRGRVSVRRCLANGSSALSPGARRGGVGRGGGRGGGGRFRRRRGRC